MQRVSCASIKCIIRMIDKLLYFYQLTVQYSDYQCMHACMHCSQYPVNLWLCSLDVLLIMLSMLFTAVLALSL